MYSTALAFVIGVPSVQSSWKATVTDLVPKEADARKHSELILAHANAAALSGKRFQNFVQRLDFAAEEVRSYLKARSRIIQLTDCDDGVLEVAEHRVIYEYHEDEVSSPAEIKRKKRSTLEELV